MVTETVGARTGSLPPRRPRLGKGERCPRPAGRYNTVDSTRIRANVQRQEQLVLSASKLC